MDDDAGSSAAPGLVVALMPIRLVSADDEGNVSCESSAPLARAATSPAIADTSSLSAHLRRRRRRRRPRAFFRGEECLGAWSVVVSEACD